MRRESTGCAGILAIGAIALVIHAIVPSWSTDAVITAAILTTVLGVSVILVVQHTVERIRKLEAKLRETTLELEQLKLERLQESGKQDAFSP
jgi:hypothetical protein